MRFFSLAALAFLVAPALAAPTGLKTLQKASGSKKEGSYIVTLAEGVSKDDHIAKLTENLGAEDSITHGEWSSSVLNGFAAKLSPKIVDFLLAHPEVASVEEDGIAHTMATVTQTDAPWGLQRISQRAKLTSTSTSALTYTYNYDSTAGSGVDVYVVDTGIYTAHSTFGGRASWGATFGGYADADGNGHGTHVAGTVAGSQYGVAKAANVIAVKVLSDAGSGAYADIISGLSWVATQAAATGRPTIATMSLGGSGNTALDNSVASLTGAGIHVTVAAGNSATDAGSTSPARAPSAITVGASTIADAIASFSNYGSIVDIFAPGQYVTSSWIGSTTATNNISGTSMATPHIAGLAAYLIALEGNVTPAALSAKIQSYSTKNALTGVPSGTVNDLAYNNIV